ncbi:PDR/VanB family oxidoreductase [Herbaspirillum autotrophicum]|uniref:PDR/VanB family oxidoreductase n=1 Tax=Herbaspirillum autotrophicum TaxID=180195 RepID=UPI00067AF775|nr:PDR/VanB family oxidoreductase [Herbaspirillum autotrophicum]
MNTLSVKVTKKTVEARDIVSFELMASDGGDLPSFAAGAHVDVHVAPGIVRQYSLCNAPHERHRYRIAVLRDPASRGGSAGMHDAVAEGDVIQISAPKNHFALTAAPRVLLLAGGIGVTPLLCMAQAMAASGADFDMHYCGRSLSSIAFQAEIAASAYGDKVHFHADDGAAEQKLDIQRLLAANAVGTPLYVCGPGGFIDFVMQSARQAGWEDSQIHREYFGAAAVSNADAHAFEVQAASTGKRYRIPADKSVIEVLAEQGVEIPVSCEQGVCGTCITRVLEGVPDHRDMYFNDEEHARNDQFTPCCSRAKSALLVLDI